MSRPKGSGAGLCASCWWNLWRDERTEHGMLLCLTPDGRSMCREYRSQPGGRAIESGKAQEAAR